MYNVKVAVTTKLTNLEVQARGRREGGVHRGGYSPAPLRKN